MLRVALIGLLAAVPASESFTLPAYDFGNGSGTNSSANYQLQSSVDSPGDELSSANYKLPAGIRASTTVAAPVAPSLTNPNSSYDQLQLILNTAGQASDTKYAIAISSDGFSTTYYVQPDQTVGSSFTLSNYQSYAALGGASGFWILGLNNSTTYAVKVAALQGGGTGSAFGPSASAATSAPSLTFGLSTSLTSTPPFSTSFTSLTPGSVVTGDATVTASLTTNAAHGGALLIKGQNNGLFSSTKAATIVSSDADLATANSGYGAQITSTSQTSGGPLVALSPYNGAGSNVGSLTTSWQSLGSFAAPITGGDLTLNLKAKATSTTPASSDYADKLTLSLSVTF